MGGVTCDDYIEPADPRRSDCLRCARPAQAHPDRAVTRLRNIESERTITREAARGVVDPEPLITHSEMRALSLASGYVSDPMTVKLNVDQDRETREELADARVRLVWAIEDDPGSEKSRARLIALRHVTLAYDVLLREA